MIRDEVRRAETLASLFATEAEELRRKLAGAEDEAMTSEARADDTLRGALEAFDALIGELTSGIDDEKAWQLAQEARDAFDNEFSPQT